MKKALADAARRTNRRPPIHAYFGGPGRGSWQPAPGRPGPRAAFGAGAAARRDLYAGTAHAFGQRAPIRGTDGSTRHEAAARPTRRGPAAASTRGACQRNRQGAVDLACEARDARLERGASASRNGAERRKGWTNAMKRAGRCSYSLESVGRSRRSRCSASSNCPRTKHP